MNQKTKKQLNHLDFEIQFYEGVLNKKPNFIQALFALGDSYTKRGFFEKGLAIDKRLTCLKPEEPIVWYNLACSYALLNDIDKSLEALNKSINLGYNDFDFMLRDPDLKNLQKDSRFVNLIASLKRKNE
ncbi:MAG: hypothetical protein Q8O13_00970 [Candidatus Omnitrophota bacterium]|nr:hypothetical protein [Candidatus Omnitrophota bacterium]